jgi:hypothetical protein
VLLNCPDNVLTTTAAVQARTVPGTGIVISKLAGDYLDSSGRCATLPAAKNALQPQQPQQRPVQHDVPGRWRLWFDDAEHDSPVPTAADASVAAVAATATGVAAEAVAVAAAGLRSGLHLAARAMQLAFRQRQQQQQQQHWQAGTAKPADAGALCLFTFGGKWYLLAAQKMGWCVCLAAS